MPKKSSPKKNISPYKMRKYKNCLASKGGVAQSLTERSGKRFNRKLYCAQSFGLKPKTENFKKLEKNINKLYKSFKDSFKKKSFPKRKSKNQRTHSFA